MKGRTPNSTEKRWMNDCRELGCIVCIVYLETFTPPAIHHIDGKTKPGSHLLSIPLCDKHHQHSDNAKPKRWISRHGDGRAAFEKEYAAESELLEITRTRING